MTIFVGSTNPVKINAVTTAASETYPEVKIVGLEAASGISAQPMSDEETRTGAINRAKKCLAVGRELHPEIIDPDMLGIGLEGGVMKVDDQLWSTVWVAVVDLNNQVYLSNGARFPVPAIIAQPILAGREMGPVVAKLVGEADVRKKQGMIGVITGGFVDRTEEYTGIAKMALGLWYGRNWQQGLVS